jgi:hypothetical protein
MVSLSGCQTAVGHCSVVATASSPIPGILRLFVCTYTMRNEIYRLISRFARLADRSNAYGYYCESHLELSSRAAEADIFAIPAGGLTTVTPRQGSGDSLTDLEHEGSLSSDNLPASTLRACRSLTLKR